ncbi:MAG: MmcQ/YjbR family DNA-binding protein [Nocardioidaceae bacterium]
MATQDDVRRIALSLPEVFEEQERFAFAVPNRGKGKGIAWVWLERVHPKRARVPQHKVLAIRVGSDAEKHELVAADPETFFTEPHYNGYPAVLVRLESIDVDELTELLTDAWRIQAPKALVKEFDAVSG